MSLAMIIYQYIKITDKKAKDVSIEHHILMYNELLPTKTTIK